MADGTRTSPAPFIYLELEAATYLAEVVEEGEHDESGGRRCIQTGTGHGPVEPISQDRLADQSLEARRHVRAVVLKAVRGTCLIVVFSPRKRGSVHGDLHSAR